MCGTKHDPENKREPMCAFKHTEGADGEPKKRNNAAVVANTLDITQASKEVTSLNSRVKGDFSAWCCRYSSEIYSA